MSQPFRGDLRRAVGRIARRLVHARRLWRDDRFTARGIELLVPRGVCHPLMVGSSGFFLRTAGPMIAPGQRVLVLDCGAGLDVVGAATRGALVTGRDLDPRAVEATRANLERAGLPGAVQVGDGLGGGPWDLVLWNPEDPTRLEALLGALPEALGERGRLVLGAQAGSTTRDRALRALPDEFRMVQLARDLGLLARYEVLSLGFDFEAARVRRHAERRRSSEAKAAVSRRRWESGETDASAEEIDRVMEQTP